MSATGLTRQQLVGAELDITANLAAREGTDVAPHQFELVPAEPGPPRAWLLSAVA